MGFILGIQEGLDIHKSIRMIHHINKKNDKNHMVTSAYAEKAFDKIQHTLVIKTSQHRVLSQYFLITCMGK